MEYAIRQEEFWAGGFGDDYISRNDLTPANIATYLAMWARLLSRMAHPVRTVLEIGPNIGLNLRAINELAPEVKLSGVEINSTAAG
jgi:hypothetical protein